MGIRPSAGRAPLVRPPLSLPPELRRSPLEPEGVALGGLGDDAIRLGERRSQGVAARITVIDMPVPVHGMRLPAVPFR